MKISKLLAFATMGIITGLLIENKVLHVKQAATAKARKAEKTIKDKLS